MKRMAIALFELAKSVVARPVKPSKQSSSKLHWTKFEKPLDQITEVERRAAAEKLANEMLNVIKDQEK
jgi:hypothetical protein